MENIGLILEGGGMRGAYTAGVLDYFLDAGITFPYVVGASAGACNGSSYVANQRGRNYRVIVEYGNHPEYISYKRWFKSRQLFGMDFLFDTLPNQLVPFDYEAFEQRSTIFVVGTTDMETGRSMFFKHFPDREALLKIMRASSSLPMLAPSISYDGRELMDGGISDPIPIQPSIDQGNRKHVVILTRNEGYIKRKLKAAWYLNQKYKQYPKFAEALLQRHARYNRAIDQIRMLENNGSVYVLRPSHPLQVSRIERNKNKLHALYMQGYEEANKQENQISRFLKS